MTVDARFVELIPAELQCPCCRKAAYPPFIICHNAHLVCETCSKHSNASCPACREQKLARPQPSSAATLKLGQYTYLCRNAPDGCPWKGKVDTETEHATMYCGYRNVTCTLCNALYRVDQRGQHVAICPELAITCSEGGRDCLGPRNSGVFPRCESAKHAREFCRSRPCTSYLTSGTRTSATNLVEHERACNALIVTCHAQDISINSLEAALQRGRRQQDDLAQRLDARTSELKEAQSALDKERKRRRALQDECTDLLDDLRAERERYAPSRRTSESDRFARPQHPWSPSRESLRGDDRWAPKFGRRDAY